LLEIARAAVEIAAHQLDLRGDRSALRRQRRKQRKESLPLTAGFVGLGDGAVEIRLLFGDGVLRASDLVGTGRVRDALVDRGKLAFEPHADGI
jgi:hypothetical protein